MQLLPVSALPARPRQISSLQILDIKITVPSLPCYHHHTYRFLVGGSSDSINLAKLHTPIKQSFDKVNDSLKDIHSGLGKYQKALDKAGHSELLESCDSDIL